MSKVIRNNTSGAIQLSPHFFLSELTDSDRATRDGIDNSPNPLAQQNLFKLAGLLEEVRTLVGGKVISVSSGYRSKALNVAIGGALNSDHMTGEAADFVCRSFGTPLQVADAISKSKIRFGQLIYEGGWVHISLPTRENNGEILTARFVKQANGRTKVTYVRGIIA